MIKLENEKLEEILGDDLTIVDYYADWCGPCQMLAIELEELKDVSIIKIDTDSHQELAISKGIMSIPYVEIYKGKELKTHFLGFKTKDEIEKMLSDI